jgi:hypothetical protein
MAKFAIEPHFRLQEWVAAENGHFDAVGLDYEFREYIRATGGKHHNKGETGAFQSIEQGRTADVTCACHWTVNVAASKGLTKLFADAYSVAPSGIFVRRGSPIERPEDLAGVPISVGFQSGSHYATIQALEPFMARDKITLSFGEGMLFHRLAEFLDGKAEAACLFNGPYYLAEQLGYRKIVDTSFMIAAMINTTADTGDVARYFEALRRAQRDLDLRHDRYTRHYLHEFPEALHGLIDTRRWGPGERIVFEPYSRETYETSFAWIAEREIFKAGDMGACAYEAATVSLSG